MHELIGDITLCILFAWVLGLLAHFSRQPLILAYLIAGFFIGPFGMGWVKSKESISVISELGLIFMLFMIGLEIDLKKIVRAGKVILFAAGGQLIGGCLLGILFFAGIGLSLGGGHFAVNGVEQAAGQIFAVTAAQLAQTTFVPAANASDDLLVGATDGHVFSGWSNLHVNGPVNHAPVVSVPNSTVNAAAGQTLQMSTLVSATDADNERITYSLDAGAPANMSIDPFSGELRWPMPQNQAPGDYPVTVRATDNGTPALSDAKLFTIHVQVVNQPPVLNFVGIDTFTYQAVDAPSNTGSAVTTVTLNVGGLLTIPQNLTPSGTTVTVPVILADPNPDNSGGMANITIGINYDATKLSLPDGAAIDVVKGALLSAAGWSFTANSPAPGKIVISTGATGASG